MVLYLWSARMYHIFDHFAAYAVWLSLFAQHSLLITGRLAHSHLAVPDHTTSSR